MLLPDRCSIKEKGGDCPNPPSYAVSIIHDSGEYMVCVVCKEHRGLMESHVNAMQCNGELPKVSVRFIELRQVGTDCIANYLPKEELVGADSWLPSKRSRKELRLAEDLAEKE